MVTTLPKSFVPDPVLPAGTPKSFTADKEAGVYRFMIPDANKQPAETRDAKLARLQEEAAQAKKESDAANSPLGFAKNFGKAFVGKVANSQVELGETLGKIISGPPKVDTVNKLADQQTQLIKMIREKESKGVDTTKLRVIFNSNATLLDEQKKAIEDYNATLPSNAKVAGQLAGTALDVLTAGSYGKTANGLKSGVLGKASIPDAVKIVTPLGKKTGILSAKGAGRVLKGGALGYVSDVTQGLQGNRGENRDGAAAFVPGLGTALGAGIPAALETEKTVIDAGKRVFTKEGKDLALIANRRKELDKLDSLQTLRKTTEKGSERGIDVKKVLSETDVLHGAVDKNGVITTKGDGGPIAQYTKEFVDGNENVVSQALKKEGRSIAPQLVKRKLMDAIKKSGIEGASLIDAEGKIDKELAGYSRRSAQSGAIPLTTLHDAKVDKYSNINFFTEGATKKYDKVVAKALKELVEENTTSIAVKDVNKELAKHFAVIDYLEKLDGKRVDGGKLGKYFAKTVGAIVGSHFGPLGAIGGAEAGGLVKGQSMSRVFNGKTGITQAQAPAIVQANDFLNVEPLRLPQASSNSLGSRQISQATTNIPMSSGIPSSIAPTMSVFGRGETAPAGSLKAITDTIGRHLTESKEALDLLPPETIARDGGVTALLERTKTNIVDGLSAEGATKAAETIAKISTSAFRSLEEYADAIASVINK